MKISSILVILCFGIGYTHAQVSRQLNSAEIQHNLRKLEVLSSTLYIAAHPDDENTRLLTYLSNEKKFRTAYLSLTRGDGGQNLIGNEQSELLGLIRTHELLGARRIDGAEQFFTRAVDFGFSKTTSEALSIWDHQKVLEDAVWVIRKFRPDLIITRFPDDSRAGHGQHSASAVIAREAFEAAADPDKFPHQLKYYPVWQAKRLLWNTSNFGGNNLTRDDQLKLDIGGFNPLLGKSYGEIAADSRTNHKSQGFGSAKQRGELIEYFQHLAGARAHSDIFEGLSSNWSKVPGSEKVLQLIRGVNKEFSPEKPSASLEALVNILNALEDLKDPYWRDQKTKEVKELILSVTGLWFESYSERPMIAVGDTFMIRSQVLLRNPAQVQLISVNKQKVSFDLEQGKVRTVDNEGFADMISQPYWLMSPASNGTYAIDKVLHIGEPESPAVFTNTFTFNVAGKEIRFERPIAYKYTDPVRGEVYQPLVITPPVTATFTEKAYIFKNGEARNVRVNIRSFSSNKSGKVVVTLPPGWKSEPAEYELRSDPGLSEKTVEFKIIPGKVQQGSIGLSIRSDNYTYDRGFTHIAYDHIPSLTLFPPAIAKFENLDLRTGGKNIGYLPGAGDMIPRSLEQVGFQVTILNTEQILATDLSKFDAIITGVRAYNVIGIMSLIQPRLLEYVASGGVLLVQYNTSQDLQVNNIGPYPLKLSRDRVTEEGADVRILDPTHRVLNYPNKIQPDDFKGWIQERGLYFVGDSDPRYARLLSMNDQGESPKDGSLLVANYGKGRFVYTSLAFFRELPAGIPGAYRLFVNLISK